MLFFPAIANSRHHSQIRICQHNLQQLGVALERRQRVAQLVGHARRHLAHRHQPPVAGLLGLEATQTGHILEHHHPRPVQGQGDGRGLANAEAGVVPATGAVPPGDPLLGAGVQLDDGIPGFPD